MFRISPNGETAIFSVDLEAPSCALLDLMEQAIEEAPARKVLLAMHEILGPKIGFLHLVVRGKVANVEDFREWVRDETDIDGD